MWFYGNGVEELSKSSVLDTEQDGFVAGDEDLLSLPDSVISYESSSSEENVNVKDPVLEEYYKRTGLEEKGKEVPNEDIVEDEKEYNENLKRRVKERAIRDKELERMERSVLESEHKKAKKKYEGAMSFSAILEKELESDDSKLEALFQTTSSSKSSALAKPQVKTEKPPVFKKLFEFPPKEKQQPVMPPPSESLSLKFEYPEEKILPPNPIGEVLYEPMSFPPKLQLQPTISKAASAFNSVFRPSIKISKQQEVKERVCNEMLKNLRHDGDTLYYETIKLIWPKSPSDELYDIIGDLFIEHIKHNQGGKSSSTSSVRPTPAPACDDFPVFTRTSLYDPDSARPSASSSIISKRTPFLDFALPILGMDEKMFPDKEKKSSTKEDTFMDFWNNANRFG